MLEKPSDFVRSGKLSKTQIIRPNQKNTFSNLTSSDLKKITTLKQNDVPDTINENNPNIFKSEKLLNIRKRHRHMTQIPHQIDKPDILFGLNEYKEPSQKKFFHPIKRLSSSKLALDLPDTLEPIIEDKFEHFPQPELNKSRKSEESKNSEMLNMKNKSILKLGDSRLSDIKEKEESEGLKTDENRDNKNNDENNEKKEELKNKLEEASDDKNINIEKKDNEPKEIIDNIDKKEEKNDEENNNHMKLLEEERIKLENDKKK